MGNDTLALSFTVPNPDEWGLTKVYGIARLEEGLVLEFQRQDAVVGLLRFGPREVRIPYQDIHAVSIQKRWLSTDLTLDFRTLRAIADVPGSRGNTLRLRVPGRRHRRQVRSFTTELEYRILSSAL